MNYNELAKTIHANNVAVGWWDNKDSVDPLEKLQLVSTEIAEATEGERKNIMDDHLPHRRMGEVELADAMIRLLDFGGAYGCVYDKRDGWLCNNLIDIAKSVAGKHLAINAAIIDLARNFVGADTRIHRIDERFTQCVHIIEHVANDLGYDLEAAMTEKLAYNEQRADHKRENRAKEGGKAF